MYGASTIIRRIPNIASTMRLSAPEVGTGPKDVLAETGDNPKDNWGWTRGSVMLLKIFDDMLEIPELS